MSHKAKELIFVGFFLLIVLFVFFGNALRDGQVLVASDGIFTTPFFSETTPTDFKRPSNPALFDQVYQFAPWRHFVWQSMREGQLPLWNPYSYSGTPLIATMQAAVFYPINLLLLLLPFEQTFVWSAILRLLIAGLSTYWLARRYGLGIASSLIAALSFMLSGFLIGWLGHPHVNVAVWLPALILMGDLLVTASTRKDQVRYTCCTALVLGVQLTGGHIETFVDSLFALGLYSLLRWIEIIRPQQSSVRSKLKQLFLLPLSAIVGGVALAAIQLLPFIEWLPLSAELHYRSFATFELLHVDFWKELLTLPLIIFPNLSNNPTWNDPYWSFIPFSGSYQDSALYIGVLSFVLAVIAVTQRNILANPVVRLWLVIAIVAFGRAFRLPVIDWLNQIPIISLGHYGRLRLIMDLSLCLLAGFGAEPLWEAFSNRQVTIGKLWTGLCVGIATLGMVIAVGSNTILPMLRGWVTAYGRRAVDAQYSQRLTHSQPLEYYYAQVDRMIDGLLAAFRVDHFAMYAPAILALAGILVFAGSMRYLPVRRLWILKAIVLSLVFVDLAIFGKDFNPSIPISQFYPKTSAVAFLERDSSLFRVTALRQDLVPDAHMMFDLSDIRGLDFPLDWYNRYLDLVDTRIPWLTFGAIFASADSPLLRALGIKYVFAADRTSLEHTTDEGIVRQFGNIYVREITNFQKRSFMVYNAIPVSSDAEALRLLKDSPDSVFRRVLISDVASLPNPPTDRVDNASIPKYGISVISYRPNETIWKVVTDRDGYMFNSDAYYPGWRAYIDNRPTDLYRANVAFRAVYVPQGEHTLVFRYEPLSIWIGATLSAISLCGILSLLLASYWLPAHNKFKNVYKN